MSAVKLSDETLDHFDTQDEEAEESNWMTKAGIRVQCEEEELSNLFDDPFFGAMHEDDAANDNQETEEKDEKEDEE